MRRIVAHACISRLPLRKKNEGKAIAGFLSGSTGHPTARPLTIFSIHNTVGAMSQREHWDQVYRQNIPSQVSWFQAEAQLSLDFIHRIAPERDAPIIDVGGGASTLVDGLLDSGYRNVAVLDIAGAALRLAQQRLGERTAQVEWIESDVLTAPLQPRHYAVWHDRAVFHFLTDGSDRARYVTKARATVRPGGYVIVASFAPEGPLRCSGLEVVRYTPDAMHAQFGEGFQLLNSVREEHHTPSGATQAFVYCLCRVDA